MAVMTISTQEAGVAVRLTHRARRQPQEEVTLICGGTGALGRIDTHNVLPWQSGAQRKVSGESKDWFRFQ